MLTEKGIMHTEVAFNDAKTERYLLRKVWDESKPIVCLIMTNPSSANAVTIDMTLHYAISNLHKLNYGGMDILNMTSEITTKLDTKNGITLSETNVDYILKSAEKSDKVILAWGRCGEGNKKIRAVQMKLLEKLNLYSDKLFVIASETGEFGFHPLAPQIRFYWQLIPFVRPEYLKEQAEDRDEARAESQQSEPSADISRKERKNRKESQEAQTA